MDQEMVVGVKEEVLMEVMVLQMETVAQEAEAQPLLELAEVQPEVNKIRLLLYFYFLKMIQQTQVNKKMTKVKLVKYIY